MSERAYLAPTGALLEAISDLLWGFTNRQVLLDIAAVPLVPGELHAEGVILCEGVSGGPPRLLVGVGPDQKVCAWRSKAE